MPDQQSSSKMPPLGRFPSFSKRHASFNSPREVPLPSPVLCQSDAPNPFFTSTTPTHSPPPSAGPSRPRSPASPSQRAQLTQDDLSFSRKHRPYNLAHHTSYSNSAVEGTKSYSQRTSNSRYNTSDSSQPAPPPESSPIHSSSRPMSIPESQSASFSTTLTSYLRQTPPQSPTPALRSTTWIDRNSSASLPLPSQVPYYALPRAQPSRMLETSKPGGERGPSADADSASDRSGLSCPSLDSSNSSSSSSSSSSSGSSYASSGSPASSTTPEFEQPVVNKPSIPLPTANSRPPSRPISPFRAPRRPSPPPVQPPNRIPEYTAMRRYMSPIQQETPVPEPGFPTILDTEAPDNASSFSSSSAPYAPFLSHAPAPADCWLEIESTESAYRLTVRLPGFTREGITLATKRRRILHVGADKWENGGGHFERRIAFGYDADLVQVRAEFDGSTLRITIPRRTAPIFF